MKNKFTLILTLTFAFQVSFSQQTVSGTITDADNQPLPGATVVVQGTSTATTTDFDGNYSIAAANGDVLVVSYVGYTATEITVNGTSMNVSLTISTALDEVVVTALGVTRDKKSLGYAVQTVSGESVGDVKSVNAIEALQGEVAGLDVQAFNYL